MPSVTVTHLATIFPRILKKTDQDRGAACGWMPRWKSSLIRPTISLDPGAAWKRIRQSGRNPQVLGRMKALAAWREGEAQHKNIPRGRIMRDETLADIASHPPKSQGDLAKGARAVRCMAGQ